MYGGSARWLSRYQAVPMQMDTIVNDAGWEEIINAITQNRLEGIDRNGRFLESRTTMLSFNCKLLFSVSSILIYLVLTTAEPNYIQYYCLGNNYTATSPFSFNINHLLSSLSSASSKNGFYNTTAGQYPHVVYGIFLCRGDVTTSVCQSCIRTAYEEIKHACPVEEEAIIWYDLCMLRYSTRDIFSHLEQSPDIYEFGAKNFTDLEQFSQRLGIVMNNLVSQASSPSSTNMFVTGEENFTRFDTLYGLVQCTPDISHSDCNTCLVGALAELSNCCNGSRFAGVFQPSCNLMYADSNSLLQFESNGSDPQSSATDTNSRDRRRGNSPDIVVIITVPTVSMVILIFIMCFFYVQRKNYKQNGKFVDKITSEDTLQFEFSTIEAATDNFSDVNKLGVGGFGVVYKGRLSDGQEIAVKRLSVNSTQGEVEFKNEVTLVAKLQHRNLVSLLGFCVEGKQLIYEFVPNKSLDYYLFDPVKRADLNWEKCYNIIEGIARGLLYLHVDSPSKIIHRDLKPSNILLDAKMNPKISDFGLAKLVVMGQTRENTNRIAGTRGYMPPEYAIKGQFSEKSDIYSFGVILLEIISGKRINGFYHWESSQNLLGYAWRLWHEGKELEFIEPLLRDTSPTTEVLRCLLIGLLCVQGDAECRPTMSTVILMLQQTLNTLPLPRQPPASMASTSLQENRNPLNPKITSVNEVTLSGFSPR